MRQIRNKKKKKKKKKGKRLGFLPRYSSLLPSFLPTPLFVTSLHAEESASSLLMVSLLVHRITVEDAG